MKENVEAMKPSDFLFSFPVCLLAAGLEAPEIDVANIPPGA